MRDEEAEAHASAARAEAMGGTVRGRFWCRVAHGGCWLPKPEASRLMEAVVERSNLFSAYERVVKNEGAPGVDGLTVSEFKPWFSGTGYGYDRLLMGVYHRGGAQGGDSEAARRGSHTGAFRRCWTV